MSPLIETSNLDVLQTYFWDFFYIHASSFPDDIGLPKEGAREVRGVIAFYVRITWPSPGRQRIRDGNYIRSFMQACCHGCYPSLRCSEKFLSTLYAQGIALGLATVSKPSLLRSVFFKKKKIEPEALGL